MASPAAEAHLRPGRSPPRLRASVRGPFAQRPPAPFAASEQRVPPPSARLGLPERARPPCPAPRPRHWARPMGGGSCGPAPPHPPAATQAQQSGVPRARARGAGATGGAAVGVHRDRKGAPASEADVCTRIRTHTAPTAGDPRGSRSQSPEVPSPRARTPAPSSLAEMPRCPAGVRPARPKISGPRDSAGWRVNPARAARRSGGVTLASALEWRSWRAL